MGPCRLRAEPRSARESAHPGCTARQTLDLILVVDLQGHKDVPACVKERDEPPPAPLVLPGIRADLAGHCALQRHGETKQPPLVARRLDDHRANCGRTGRRVRASGDDLAPLLQTLDADDSFWMVIPEPSRMVIPTCLSARAKSFFDNGRKTGRTSTAPPLPDSRATPLQIAETCFAPVPIHASRRRVDLSPYPSRDHLLRQEPPTGPPRHLTP